MKKKAKKKKIIIILISLILLILLIGHANAKMGAKINLKGNIEVANPILEIDGIESSKISAIEDTGYYEFKIRNYNENNISDVSQNYTIEVISSQKEALEIELYEQKIDEATNEIKEEKINMQENKTEPININGVQKEERNYKLKIKYNKSKSESEENIAEDIQLKIHSEQQEV